MKHNGFKFMGHSKSSSKKEMYSNTSLTQEIREISIKQSKLTTERTRKIRASKAQIE